MKERASHEYGVDRGRALAESGVSRDFPGPDEIAAADGELTGIWLSVYAYESSSADKSFTSRHYVLMRHSGSEVLVDSMPAAASRVRLTLSANGRVLTGTWGEETDVAGSYGGALYYGGVQLIAAPDGKTIAGAWTGFGRGGEVNVGPWTLAFVDADVDPAAIARWNREPE